MNLVGKIRLGGNQTSRLNTLFACCMRFKKITRELKNDYYKLF